MNSDKKMLNGTPVEQFEDPIALARSARKASEMRQFGGDVDYIHREEMRRREMVRALQRHCWAPDSEEARAAMLPPLLERRRQEHLIPNGCFSVRPLYDRVLIYRTDIRDTEEVKPETFGDTNIIMPEASKDRRDETQPRGIIVAAGIIALDQLETNGVELGHVVRFQAFTHFGHEVDVVNGHRFFVWSILAGQIMGSEDLEREVREGRKYIRKDPQGFREWAVKDQPPNNLRVIRPDRGMEE